MIARVRGWWWRLRNRKAVRATADRLSRPAVVNAPPGFDLGVAVGMTWEEFTRSLDW